MVPAHAWVCDERQIALTSLNDVAPWLVVVLDEPRVPQDYPKPCDQLLLAVNVTVIDYN